MFRENRDIDGYQVAFTGTQLRRGQRDHPEVQKKCPDFGKKGLDCIRLWVKFSIRNVVLGASKRKKSKMFLYKAFFIVFDEIPLKCPT